MPTHQRCALNVAPLDTGQYPFINWLKQQVKRSFNTGVAFNTSLDANAYPKSGVLGLDIKQGGLFTPANYTGPWVLKWTGKCGNGTVGAWRIYGQPAPFTVTTGASFVIGATTSELKISGTDGRIVFTANGVTASSITNNWQMDFLSGGTFDGTLSNMILCRASDEAAVDAGEIFLPEFLASISELNPQVLRFLDWSGINEVVQTKFGYRSQIANFTWNDYLFAAGAWGGSTSGTDTYTCSAAPDTPGTYTDMEAIQVFFTNANTITTPTLNVGARGAKTIKTTSFAALSVGSIAANSLHTLVYDATLDCWGMYGQGFANSVPIEIQIELCNQLNCDYWFLINGFMFDSANVTSYIQLIRDNLNPGLKCYFEYSNETWNSNFKVWQWLQKRSTSATYGFSGGGVWSIVGLYIAQIAGYARAAWSPRTASELKIVNPLQMYGDNRAAFGSSKYQLSGFELAAYGHNTAPNRPIDFSDVLSYAIYCNGSEVWPNYGGTNPAIYANFLAACDDYASGVPATMAAALAWVDNDIRNGPSGSNKFPINTSMVPIFEGWKTTGDTLVSGGIPFVCYEGGIQIDNIIASECTTLGISSTYVAKSIALLDAYRNSQAFYDTQYYLFQAFVDASDITTAIPCQYYHCLGQTSPWALINGNLIDTTPFQSFDAIVEWNAVTDTAAAPTLLGLRLRLHA